MITQSKYTEKQKAILSVAAKLFVEFGFDGTPTSKIADAAGIAHGTLFHYFNTKNELILALYLYIKENLRNYLMEKINESGDLKKRFNELFYFSIEWSLENNDEFYFTQQFRYSPHLKQLKGEELAQQTSLHREFYHTAITVKAFKPLPVDLISSLVLNQIIGTYEYINGPGIRKTEKDKIIKRSSELVWEMCSC